MRANLESFIVEEAFEHFTARDDLLCAYYDHVVQMFNKWVPGADPWRRTAVALTWSWMGLAPPKADWQDHYGELEDALARSDCSNVDEHLCRAASKFVGGSFIAASKFLHFKFPEVYPIWDGNVAILTHEMSGQNVGKAYEAYLEYVGFIKDLTVPPGVEKEFASRNLGHWTRTRKLEFVIYLQGRSRRRETRAEKKNQRMHEK